MLYLLDPQNVKLTVDLNLVQVFGSCEQKYQTVDFIKGHADNAVFLKNFFYRSKPLIQRKLKQKKVVQRECQRKLKHAYKPQKICI